MYHFLRCEFNQKWTLQNTANFFEVSTGLVSENLKLAELFSDFPDLAKFVTRRDALAHIEKIKFNKYRVI